MRKSFITLLILGLVLMPLSLAEMAVCFDFQAPDAPTGLTISKNVLTWTASFDGPANCSSGVDYYAVYRDDALIGTTSSITYKDVTLSPGTYVYKVAAVDTVGNGEGAAATGTVTIATSSGGGSSGGTTSAAEDWDCSSNWSSCINGTQTQVCTHKIMAGVTKTNTQNCTVQIIQETNQTTINQTAVQNQTQNQTGPIMIINQTQNQTQSQTETIENLTGHNIIIINIPMRLAQEKEEIRETIAAQEATSAQSTVPEQGSNQTIASEEQDDSLSGAAVGAGSSNVPWALIIFCVALIAATLVFVLMLRKPEKEEEKPAKEKKEKKLMELEVPGGELEVPTPFGPIREEKEEEWVELNDIRAPDMPSEEKKEEKWIEIKVPAWRKRNAKKVAAKNVKKKAPIKKPANKNKIVRKK